MEIVKLDNLLSATSPTFCMAKFHEATIWLYSGKIASCHHNPFHDVGNTVETFYNTPVKREQQKRMLAGERPDACGYCWRLEDQGSVSDRRIKSLNYPHHLDAGNYLRPDYPFRPQVLELAFQKTCNLGCSYCNADFSTQWVNDIRNNGVYKNIVTDQRLHYQRPITDYQDQPVDTEIFWQWLRGIATGLDIIRVTGGEPMLHEETFQLLDLVRELNPRIKIAINSNLCQKPTVLERFKEKIKGLKKVSIYTSNESAGQVAELLRHGMDYNQWRANLASLDDAGLDHIFVMTTIGAACLQNFDRFLLDVIETRSGMKTPVTVDFNFMTYPEFQSISVLDQLHLDYYHDRYERWFLTHADRLTAQEKVKYPRLLARLKQPKADNQLKLAGDCKSFFQQFSQRRGVDASILKVIKAL
jgi:organic radical activating enzyme